MSGSENPFQDVNEDGVHIVTLPKFLDEPKMKALEVQMKSWLLMSEVLHVFDFSETKKITPEFARPFTVFRSNLRKAEKFMASVNASPVIQKDLNGRGLKDVFNWVPEINVARREAGLALKPKSSLDAKFVSPFISGVTKVFTTQVGVETKSGRPRVRTDKDDFSFEIAGVININSPHFNGSFAVCFDKDVFLKLYEQMVGESSETITKEMEDAASEILNMVYGTAKTELNQMKYELGMVIPTVLTGEKVRLSFKSLSQTLIVPFESGVGEFLFLIIIEQNT